MKVKINLKYQFQTKQLNISKDLKITQIHDRVFQINDIDFNLFNSNNNMSKCKAKLVV